MAERNFGLDLTRTIAVGLVVLCHFANKSLDILGFWGVELFFGLSGFLIGNILWRSFSQHTEWDHKFLINFWSRRWWRTLPNYYLFFLLTIVYFYVRKDSILSVPELSRYLYFGQFYLSKTNDFYGMSWSLCVEEWFYLSFPLILFILQFLKLSKQKTFCTTIVLIYLLTTTVKFWLSHHDPEATVRQITLARLDGIASGVLIAFIQAIAVIPARINLYSFILGVLAVFVPFLIILGKGQTFEDMKQDYFYLSVVPLGFSLCLPYISKINWQVHLKIAEAVKKISIWSYSIYLSHIYIMFTVYYLTDRIRTNSSIGNLLSKIIALAVTVFLSSLVFRYFEAPFTSNRPRELTAGKQLSSEGTMPFSGIQ